MKLSNDESCQCTDGRPIGNTWCCKLLCADRVIDIGLELLIEEPNSNSICVRFIPL